MEITVQWLDELEDFVFAIALLWEPLRRILLNIGLMAAVALHVAQPAVDHPVAPILAGTALGCVAVWCTAWLVRATIGDRELGSSAAA